MTPEDRVTLQNWISACDRAHTALTLFESYLHAWEHHPQLGHIPADLFDGLIEDLGQARLAGWLQPDRVAALRRAVCGSALDNPGDDR
jgi:hypothetical protein